ncbi:MAG: hypothetical protein ACI9P7_002015, partial [Candidatus Azotimanducaceae bacterium]
TGRLAGQFCLNLLQEAMTAHFAIITSSIAHSTPSTGKHHNEHFPNVSSLAAKYSGNNSASSTE